MNPLKQLQYKELVDEDCRDLADKVNEIIRWINRKTDMEESEIKKEKHCAKKEESWVRDFEDLWEASFDRESDKNTFEYERLLDFVKDLLSQNNAFRKKKKI
jgi:hypothetical protein